MTLKHSINKTAKFLPDALFVGTYEGLDDHLQKNAAYEKDTILFPKLTVSGTRSLQYIQQILSQTNDRFIRIQAYSALQGNRSYSLGCPKNLPDAPRFWFWVGLGNVGEFFSSLDCDVIQNYDKEFAAELRRRQKLEKEDRLREEAIALYRAKGVFIPENKALKNLEFSRNKRIEIESRLVTLIGLLSFRKQRQDACISLLARADLSWGEKKIALDRQQNERMSAEMTSQLKHIFGNYRGSDYIDPALASAWDYAPGMVHNMAQVETLVTDNEQTLERVLLQKKAFVEKYCSDLAEPVDPLNLDTEKA